MRLIEVDKVEQAIKDYWKAQVDKALTLTFIDGNEADKRINSYLKHNHNLLKAIDELPPAEPDTTTHDSIPAETGENDADKTSGDCISRTQAIDKFIDGLEEIFADLRERHVDDSVCGLCEYDGAYMGQSGDWCNECPGFDRDDCFKLSDKTRKKWTDEIIKALPSAQPDIIRCKDCAYCDSDVVDAPYGMTKKIFWCDRLYAGANENLIVEPDDFCSWAERREDETD